MAPSPLHCRARGWGSGGGDRGKRASGGNRRNNGRHAVIRARQATREHTNGTSTHWRSSGTIDPGRRTSSDGRCRCGSVLERDGAAGSNAPDDIADNRLERRGRATELLQ